MTGVCPVTLFGSISKLFNWALSMLSKCPNQMKTITALFESS